MDADECSAREICPKSSNDFLCGWGAAFVNVIITYPVNKVMFRQMLHGVRVFPALKQLHSEGMLYLYRGVLPPLFQKTISVSLMFGTYDQYQCLLRAVWPWSSRLVSPCAAALAGLSEALLTPFERVQTLLQDGRYHARFRHSGHASRALIASHGIRELYRGLAPILLRNSLSNIIFFEGRAALGPGLRWLRREPGAQSRGSRLAGDFVSGALLGAVTSTLVYPLNVVKTQMQSRVGGDGAGVCTTLALVYRQRGSSVRRMYRGVHVNYTRSLISWGIINSAYEYFKSLST